MTKRLFFERMREKRGEVPTTFSYDYLPEVVRTQIRLIVEEGRLEEGQFEAMASLLREAVGKRRLANGSVTDGYGAQRHYCGLEVLNFFSAETDVEVALSALELIGAGLSNRYRGEQFIDRINGRLRQAGIGWMIVDRQLVQIEDETFFDNVTAPCLSILGGAGYDSAYKHFQDAYTELKNRAYDDALADCGQAIESLAKTRLAAVGLDDLTDMNWKQLKPLLKQHLVIPPYMENYQNNLFEMMGGLMTARNKDGPHGKEEGAGNELDHCFVRFFINQTAANILFLAEAEFRP